ncbi:DUF2752 domain-containing protein [Balneolaceae bacterium ANBcel3]|nr:DUF2752 domain-containing protein [Balneolaceae bacterium ANBcel3]
MISPSTFYRFFSALSVAAYIWVAFLWFAGSDKTTITLCPVKLSTGYPCPSCGTSTSVLLLLKGEMIPALLANPLGYLAFALMVFIPLWLLFDLFFKKTSLYHIFFYAERIIKENKGLLFLFILLIVVNWLWNLYKAW